MSYVATDESAQISQALGARALVLSRAIPIRAATQGSASWWRSASGALRRRLPGAPASPKKPSGTVSTTR